MYNVKLLNKIANVGLSNFDSDFVVSEDTASPDAIILRSADMHNLELPQSLRCVARAGAGTNNIPIDKCSEKSVVVFNTPGANANAVKELVIAAIILASRDIVGGIEWAKTLKGKGDQVGALVEKGKAAFVGPEIDRKSIGVIGLGAIGGPVANMAQRLGMEVYGFDPYISIDAAWGLSRSVRRAADLRTIYENCDYITIHVPATKETKGYLSAEAISQMKDGVRILNFARADLIDEDALVQAIESKKIAKYITDFPTERLLSIENVVCIPHLGASTPESEDNCAIMAVKQTEDFLKNGNIKNSVNYPTVVMERSGEKRLCVFHKNIPNMLNSIVSSLSDRNLNIENMLNRSKGELAYTILDVSSDISENTLKKINAIEGVTRVMIV